MVEFSSASNAAPVNEADFKKAADQARNLVYGLQRNGMDGLDAALGILQAVHEFVHWNVGEQGEDEQRRWLAEFFVKGMDNTGQRVPVAAPELSNEIWEIVFGATAGDVPLSLSDELLHKVATGLLTGYTIERKPKSKEL